MVKNIPCPCTGFLSHWWYHNFFDRSVPIIHIPGQRLEKTPEGFEGAEDPYPARSDIFGLECSLQVADENNVPDTPDNPEGYLQPLIVLDIHQLLV